MAVELRQLANVRSAPSFAQMLVDCVGEARDDVENGRLGWNAATDRLQRCAEIVLPRCKRDLRYNPKSVFESFGEITPRPVQEAADNRNRSNSV